MSSSIEAQTHAGFRAVPLTLDAVISRGAAQGFSLQNRGPLGCDTWFSESPQNTIHSSAGL